jgi:hypothetical protein
MTNQPTKPGRFGSPSDAEQLTASGVPTVREVAAACPDVLDWVATALENELDRDPDEGVGEPWTQNQRTMLGVFIQALRSGGLELPDAAHEPASHPFEFTDDELFTVRQDIYDRYAFGRERVMFYTAFDLPVEDHDWLEDPETDPSP